MKANIKKEFALGQTIWFCIGPIY